MLKNRRILSAVLAVIIGVSLLASFYLDYRRLQAESGNKTVGILLDYDELLTLSKEHRIALETLSARFKEAGATGVVIRERTLEDLRSAGLISLSTGGEIALQQQLTGGYRDLKAEKDKLYIFTEDRELAESLYQSVAARKPRVERGTVGDSFYIALPFSRKEQEKTGVGFVLQDLEAINKGGLSIVPRYRDVSALSNEGAASFGRSLQEIPGLSLVTFNEAVVSSGTGVTSLLAEEIRQAGAPVGTFEFFPQHGLGSLGLLLDKNVVRVHAIAENEMSRYNEALALDRYRLAVAERNIRALYVRFFGMEQPSAAYDKALSFVSAVREAVEAEGMETGTPSVSRGLPYATPLTFLIGLGAIAGGLLVLDRILGASWRKWTLALGFVGLACWAGLLFLEPLLARKAMALASVIVFPVLGCQVFVREEKRSIMDAVTAFLGMSLLSLAGALIMTGLLADKAFMLKLQEFSGVKLAHLVPLLIVPAYFLLRGYEPVRRVQALLNDRLLVKHLLAGALLLAALAVYILRTGNDAATLVSSWEATLRTVLDRILGVRPRTKEFLIGHPAMLALLYYGYDLRRLWLLLFGVIGQISLVNTYAHIHTPLAISLLRSFHGVWIGLILGLAAVMAANYGLRWYRRRIAGE